MRCYHNLVALLYEALWELVDVTLHTTHVWVEEVWHHTYPVLHALLMVRVLECVGGVCVQGWRCFRCMSVTSPPVAHGVVKSSVLCHTKKRDVTLHKTVTQVIDCSTLYCGWTSLQHCKTCTRKLTRYTTTTRQMYELKSLELHKFNALYVH